MRTLIRFVRFWLKLLPVIAGVLCRRAWRRAKWYFQWHYLVYRKKRWLPLALHIDSVFKKIPDVTDVTTCVYFGPGYGYGESTEERRAFYWEAPLAIAVWTNQGPTIGIGLEVRGRVLCVRQLQGVAGVQIPESLKKWPQLFVQTCIDFAERTRTFGEVRLYKADQSLYYKYPDIRVGEDESLAEAIRSHQKRMRRRYDGTARQLGFEKCSRWYVWKASD